MLSRLIMVIISQQYIQILNHYVVYLKLIVVCQLYFNLKNKKIIYQFLLPYFFKEIYLFLAGLGLRCCAWAFYSCNERGLLFISVLGLLMVVASLVAEHRLQARGLQQLRHTGSRAQAHQLWHMGLVSLRHLPGPGLEPMSPAEFLTTVPPGKPCICFYCSILFLFTCSLFPVSQSYFFLFPFIPSYFF